MTRDEEICAQFSTPGLRRSVLPRAAKKLNMEFDAQFNRMDRAERDAFLEKMYPTENGA